MKKLLLLLLSILIHQHAVSQFFLNSSKNLLKSKRIDQALLLKNDSIISFHKLKLPNFDFNSDPNHRIKFTLKDGTEAEITLKEIEAILDPNSGEISFLRKDEAKSYMLVTCIGQGRINLYEKNTTGYGPGFSGNAGAPSMSIQKEVTIYIEKDDVFKAIKHGTNSLVNINLSSRKQKELLLSLVGDLPETKAIVEDVNFKTKWQNILRVINTYNLHYYDSAKDSSLNNNVTPQAVDLIKMNFYTNKKLIEGSYLLDENGNKYKLSKQIAATILLPRFKESKICLVVDGIQYCDIVMAISEKNSFYEIILDEGFLHCVRGLR